MDYQDVLTIRKLDGMDTLKFNNWDDMRDTYKGTITQFVKENKPKYSPDIKNGLIMAV